MIIGRATGTQIAFFAVAVGLLVVPLAGAIAGLGFWAKEDHGLVQRLMIFTIGAALLFGVPALRRWCVRELARPLEAGRVNEVAVVALLKPMLGLGIVGGMVLFWWASEGPAGLAQRVRSWGSHEAAMAQALSAPGLIKALVLGLMLAPVLEELVFRGLLYRAWERDWGWFPAMVLTSTVFGFYHPMFWPAFFGSVVYVCVYRRTGSLWGCIIVHFLFNLLVWYPILGRFILPRGLDTPGDLATWTFHLLAFVLALILLPAYLWMSRDASAAPRADLDHEPGHEPVPQ